MENRFFSCDPVAYESTRLAIDAAQNMPVGETTYAPLSVALLNASGKPLLAIRSMHCDREPFLSAIAAALASGDMVEITAAEYRAAMPSGE